MKKIIAGFVAVLMFISGINYSYSVNAVSLSATLEGNEETLNNYAERVFELVNAERVKEGLEPLTLNDDLNEVSKARAFELTEVYSHQRPNDSLCYTILAEYGLSTKNYGENIASSSLGYSDQPKTVVDGWMSSDGHRENILDTSYTDIGIGVEYLDGYYYWVQTFSGEIRKVPVEITWSIDKNGVLNIRGVGNMENYIYGYAPWYSDREKIKKVIISSGVTSIGNYAFAGCEYITDIKFSESLSEIGNGAFENCNSLESITIMNTDCKINDSQETINNNAVIYGHSNSTAQAYAKKYDRKFISVDLVYGDSNEDGEVNIADAVIIMQALSGKDEYSLSDNGILNADVLDSDGVSTADALVIQMIVADIISRDSLPITSDLL